MYDSRSMRKLGRFKKERQEYVNNVCQVIKVVMYAQLALGALATFLLTWWAILIFSVLFLVLRSYKSDDLMKDGWKNKVKYVAYVFLSCVQIVYLLLFLLVNFAVVLMVNCVQIILIIYLKKSLDAYLTFLSIHGPVKPD